MTDDSTTPMMQQYLGIKAQYPGAILFYRMGDFYEMFFDDAVSASAALGIALTKRGQHAGQDIAMCGVPVHAAEGYLLSLIRKGFRVAIAEQMEDPTEAKKRGNKAVVRRDVVRLVTPGTLTEDSLLDARQANFLAAFSEVRDSAALAWVDISTGELRVMQLPSVRLGMELARLGPREVLLNEAGLENWDQTVQNAGAAVTPLSRASFDSSGAERRLCAMFGVATLDAFAAFHRAEVSALGALVDYLDLTQRGKLPLLKPPLQELPTGAMQIDAATRRNLELTLSLSGGRDGSLLAVMDRTVTAAGARLLERRLSNPSNDLAEIHARLESVRFMVAQTSLKDKIRDILRHVPDMDRAMSRIALDRAGPADLVAIKSGLAQAQALSPLFQTAPTRLQKAAEAFRGHENLIALLSRALVDKPPISMRDGGFIAVGYDTELDETRRLRDEGRSVIAEMQAEYCAMTAIGNLRIKHNNVLGYFIETTAAHSERMLAQPLAQTFIHRQTTANQVRFTTVRLSEIETRILNAGNHALDLEKKHFSKLRDTILQQTYAIADAAMALAEIDLATALADLAVRENWSEPVVDDSHAFSIAAGRHPVVEWALRKHNGTGFIANDCALTTRDQTPAIWLLTGPNMAGKSTFLRQNAIIALLAQTGSFVPAASAHIGRISQLFSRVGASDDLARGRSTFMVEMVETAAILNQADDRAFVILDEIGRGTATYDGLSIAWATLEHLHETNRCRALFATHYHEMTALAGKLTGVDNATVAVKEWDGDVIFLHEVRKGAADRSYGVQVARLAGLPASVIDRAKIVLEALESGEREGGARQKTLIDDLPLFRAVPSAAMKPGPKTSAAEAKLKTIHPDQLTPIDALRLIYELRDMLD